MDGLPKLELNWDYLGPANNKEDAELSLTDGELIVHYVWDADSLKYLPDSNTEPLDLVKISMFQTENNGEDYAKDFYTTFRREIIDELDL